jgi:hypothetical protein
VAQLAREGFGPPNSPHFKIECGNEGCYDWTDCWCAPHTAPGSASGKWGHRVKADPDTIDDDGASQLL